MLQNNTPTALHIGPHACTMPHALPYLGPSMMAMGHDNMLEQNIAAKIEKNYPRQTHLYLQLLLSKNTSARGCQ